MDFNVNWPDVTGLVATRAQQPEMLHALEWVLSDADGQLLHGTEGARNGWSTWMRSCAKPFQLLASVAPDQLAQHPPEALAIAAGSHSGEPEHLPWVRYWLEAAQCEACELECGEHPPLTPFSVSQPSAFSHNCSGKHGAMIWACRQNGWSTDDYTPIDHPVQQRVVRVLQDWLRVDIAGESIGVDGCGVPTFHVPLRAMAQAYARLMNDPSASVLVGSMARHAYLVAGQERLDTALMLGSGGALISKVGADAVVCVGHRASNQAIALKVVDGTQVARDRAIILLLRTMGWLSDEALQKEPFLAKIATGERLNERNQVVGHWQLGDHR